MLHFSAMKRPLFYLILAKRNWMCREARHKNSLCMSGQIFFYLFFAIHLCLLKYFQLYFGSSIDHQEFSECCFFTEGPMHPLLIHCMFHLVAISRLLNGNNMSSHRCCLHRRSSRRRGQGSAASASRLCLCMRLCQNEDSP